MSTKRGSSTAKCSRDADLAAALRTRILNGQFAPGAPLREQALAAEYDVARHTVRAALRALAAEGVVTIERNRGARVTALDAPAVQALGELRIALEVEAVRLALERNGGRLPEAAHAARRSLTAACASGSGFAAVAGAHAELHANLVAGARSPRIEAAHRALTGQLRLFLVQLQPVWDTENLAAEHEALLAAIEAGGPEALRVHITNSTEALTTGLKF